MKEFGATQISRIFTAICGNKAHAVNENMLEFGWFQVGFMTAQRLLRDRADIEDTHNAPKSGGYIVQEKCIGCGQIITMDSDGKVTFNGKPD